MGTVTGMGDVALVYVVSGLLLWGLSLGVVALVGSLIVRGLQASRMAKVMAEAASVAPGHEVAAVMREFDAAVQSVQADLQGLDAGSETARRVREERVLEELARVDALYDRLGTLRSASTATYRPVISGLHSLAAKKGLGRTYQPRS